MNNPLVSIVIPVYNGANYMREAIDSALKQTYPNIEVIVINDGSNDNGETESIALSYGNKIRYFKKENGGVATALNMGIQEMQGEYFSWLSHDDLYYPDKIERQINELRRYNDKTMIVNGDFDFFDEDLQEIIPIRHLNRYSREKLEDSFFIILEDCIHACALLIHRSHFERVGMFDEKLRVTQDMDLWFRMFRGQKLIYMENPLSVYRLHGERGTHTIPEYNHECNMRNIKYMDNISTEEMCRLYGSPYQFYLRMMEIAKGGNLMEAYRYAVKLFGQAEIPQEVEEQLSKLHKKIDEYFPNSLPDEQRKICIYCAGKYGEYLYRQLRERLVLIDFFCDSNPNKWGYVTDGISCIPPIALERYKESALIIVANKTPMQVVDDLKNKEYRFVITKQELDPILDCIPPVKWVTQWRDVDALNYSTPEAEILMRQFSQTIFDLCAYYQSRIKNTKI